MVCYELECEPSQIQNPRGFIGGTPPLPAGTTWPTCRICGNELVHFIDLEIPEEKSQPFKAKSRLQIFACREHDDIAGTIYSGYQRFESTSRTPQLPMNYWEISDGHYLIRLLAPGEPVEIGREEIRLALQNLRLVRIIESEAEPNYSFKMFGHPSWAQDPEEHVCCCGAPMRLLLQIPEGFGFDMTPGAPQQPNSFSKVQYCLFLGNELYLFGCENQCHPLALFPILQGT